MSLGCQSDMKSTDLKHLQWLNGLLLHIGQQMHDHLSTTLNHAKDRRLFFLHRPSTGFAFAAAPTAFALLALHHLRLSLMTGHHRGFIALHLVGEDHGWLFFTMPPRSAVVI